MYFRARCDEEWIVMVKEYKITVVNWGKFSNTYLLGSLVCLYLSSKYREGTTYLGVLLPVSGKNGLWGGGESDLPISSIFLYTPSA